MDLEQLIRDVPDFPKPGIVFKDITPLLANAKALSFAADTLAKSIDDDQKIDKVIGIESRGFILGPMIAERLNAGFIPVRKKGKLPFTVVSKTYQLEYGEDTLEIHTDAIQQGDRVLIHDDVLATGGTAQAVCELVNSCGGIIVGCNFIMELSFLNGRAKLPSELKALITY
ncbi:adenine phosphoribosyltransferase [Aquimarina brevivitae]|uniref:Adenine phosphoribosyltransferase n=1 Tax=Aquimarina brevivitae TaxID=323412 RepID=A0A4Q7PJ48_9FLAO|nr:adenine phosphoribosyltransferase [Aquimarina brevivitae]RZT00069.1 adenine phosphoribosyltransferase [Aquimarina brevivitae]